MTVITKLIWLKLLSTNSFASTSKFLSEPQGLKRLTVRYIYLRFRYCSRYYKRSFGNKEPLLVDSNEGLVI